MIIQKTIRILPKPKSIQIRLVSVTPTLNVVTADGETEVLRIPIKVAEYLIAYGIPYEG